MFEKFFESHPEFTTIGRPLKSELDSYRSKVPEELIYFWEQYGYGNFMNGYLKMVNPADYQGFMEETYSVFLQPATVFAVTAFGDILIWEKQWVTQINYRRGESDNQGNHIDFLFNRILGNWKNVEPAMNAEQFRPAVERLGEPAFDECFAYVPALALGGSEKVENIQKVKLREHLMILSQLVGVIE
jgi:hypothetical protein